MIRKSVKRFSGSCANNKPARRSPGDSSGAFLFSHAARLLHDRADRIRTGETMAKKVLVAGATGLVGNAALRHFGMTGGGEVIALARRKARELFGARHVALDLTDGAQCAAVSGELKGATHLIYAALHEEPNLVEGWRNPRQIKTN